VPKVVVLHDGAQGFIVGVAWLRGCRLVAGEKAHVELAPEGLQREDLAEDVASALRANPKAVMFSTPLPGSTGAGT
jgi:hypothetical protein